VEASSKVSFFRAFPDPIFYACETWITTRADLALIRKACNRLLRQALGIVTNQYLHVLASTVDVIVCQSLVTLRGFGCTKISDVPLRATMRRGQGNRTTYLGELRECLVIDTHTKLR
jgi:hypothetical protein